MESTKHGGKPITRVFLKGGADIAGALLSPSSDRPAPHPELRRHLQEKYRGAYDVELLHEPFGRSDLLLQHLQGTAGDRPPGPIGEDAAAFTPDPGTRLLESSPDVVVFSIQPDLVHTLWRHTPDAALLYPHPGWEATWPPERRRWLLDNCTPVPPLSGEQVEENFRSLTIQVKARLDAHVIMCGASSFDPSDRTHTFYSREDTLSVRIHRCNLALMRLSILEGTSLIDVDRLLAELGARQHVPAVLRHSPAAQQAIRTEFLRVLEDIGFFEPRPLLQQIGCRED